MPENIRQFKELLNHLYRICGIHECIHTYHRSRIHMHEYKIIYGGSGAFVSPKFQEKKIPPSKEVETKNKKLQR